MQESVFGHIIILTAIFIALYLITIIKGDR